MPAKRFPEELAEELVDAVGLGVGLPTGRGAWLSGRAPDAIANQTATRVTICRLAGIVVYLPNCFCHSLGTARTCKLLLDAWAPRSRDAEPATMLQPSALLVCHKGLARVVWLRRGAGAICGPERAIARLEPWRQRGDGASCLGIMGPMWIM